MNIAQYKEKKLKIIEAIERLYVKEQDTLILLEEYTRAIDNLLTDLWQSIQGLQQKYALLAIGGYGRKELYPYSDIDILILTETPIQEDPFLECFLQNLWDLKLKVSPITATPAELALLCAENLATLSSILDQRYLGGSIELYDSFCQHSDTLLFLTTAEFYAAKRSEQHHRHQNVGHSAFSLEPNIKESPGGLRDMQTWFWCVQYGGIKKRGWFENKKQNGLLALFELFTEEMLLTDDENKKLKEAYLHLAHIRFGLHLQAGKKTDRLSYEMQPELARFCGESQKDFMKKYYDSVLILLRYQDILEKNFRDYLNKGEIEEELCVSTNILAILLRCHNEADIRTIPITIMRSLLAKPLSLEEALSLENQKLFLTLLNKAPYVYPLLKTLRLWGVLSAYLPELQMAMGLIQQSLFHNYTVDEHTLFLTEMIDKFYQKSYAEKYPLCHELVFTLSSPQVLYLAALLHDSGKGHIEDHSVVGEQLTAQLCQRLSTLLSDEEQHNLIWLVKNHLLMSTVAQKQDIHDPSVIIAFAKEVENINRLKLLYLLTVADISATNPTLWNGWKDSLLKKLYQVTEKALQRDCALSTIDKKTERKKKKSVMLLAKQAINTVEALALWQNWPNVYFLHHSVPSIVKHTAFILKQSDHQAVFCFTDRSKQGHYELFIYCKDRPFLFSLFTDVLEKENLNVVSADILTTVDGHALDSFYLLREKAYTQKREHLLLRLEEALLGLKDHQTAPVFPKRFHRSRLLPNMTTEVRCRRKEGKNLTEVEIISYDRPGLLAKIGLVFASHKLNLQQAKIATLGQRVEDIFMLTNNEGLFLTELEITRLTEDLLRALKDK